MVCRYPQRVSVFHWNIWNLMEFEGTHGRRGLLLVEIFPEDDDSPNCHPFTPFLALGRGSLVSRFLGPRLKKRQNRHYYLCIDVFWQVSRCHTVETVYPPTDATIVGNNLLARTWWAWSRWRLILRGAGLSRGLSSVNRISYALKRFSQIFLEKNLRRIWSAEFVHYEWKTNIN